MSDIDLNEVRDRIKRAQRRGTPYPPNAADQVKVDRAGNIVLGDDASAEPVSVVHQATFAAVDRLLHDQRTARNKLPRNTVFIDEPAVSGWLYSITTELGHDYTLFAYFDGTDYKVKLVAPELEGKLPAHGAHLYPNGLICLDERKGNGQATLEEAYSKSVLWALGVSYVREGFTFPFSINNEDD
ncbi:hypothetical protein [Dactylosporangium sp. CA-233914]|uniref:hypothetical protein n=1 Tax=Dactylosporangium sp. CA-233914 TaxID=3239934 RepID=UPI003D8AB9FC